VVLPAAVDGAKVEVEARSRERLTGLECRHVVGKACGEPVNPVSQPRRRSLAGFPGRVRHARWAARRLCGVMGFRAAVGSVDDLACGASAADDQVVLGQLPTDRVDVDPVHLCCPRELVIVQWHRTSTDEHEDLVSSAAGARHTSIMPMDVRRVYNQVGDASLAEAGRERQTCGRIARSQGCVVRAPACRSHDIRQPRRGSSRHLEGVPGPGRDLRSESQAGGRG